MDNDSRLFVSCPRFTEDLLKKELELLDIEIAKEVPGGLYIPFSTKYVYRICLFSHIANRVLLQLATVSAESPELLAGQTSSIAWENHFSPADRFMVDCRETSEVFRNRIYAAQVVKDGICRRFTDLNYKKPEVDVKNPDISINLFLYSDKAVLSIDLSGGSLHQRNYRIKSVKAPLKENTAAAVLFRAGWRKGDNRAFLDPMCGSGTFLIEAALISAGIPPGLFIGKFGFEKWKGHKAFEYRSLRQNAEELFRSLIKNIPHIIGSDIDKYSVYAARDNIKKAGLDGHIRVYCSDARSMKSISENFSGEKGLIVFNPPYGKRLGNHESLIADYSLIGREIKQYFRGWNCSIITAVKNLSSCLGLKTYKINKLYNGGILAFVYNYEIEEDAWENTVADPGLEMFRNRLKKNMKNLSRWIREENISSYRLYDADMPEYSAAIDIYENKWIHIQEYEAPESIDPRSASRRLGHILSVLPEFTGIIQQNIFYKKRKKQHGKLQYNENREESFRVRMYEHGLSFYIDLKSYLDTGIFLDHRKTRSYILENSKNRNFLNLFCYTGTASVFAAKGGAKSTTSVDTSKTYLDWTQENFKLNGISGKNHQRVRKDSIRFLKETADRFDLVFIDPPTFSNSKSREEIFSVQRDYSELINLAIRICRPGAIIIFSTNFRKFSFNTELVNSENIKEISNITGSPDFAKSKNAHRCWEIRV